MDTSVLVFGTFDGIHDGHRFFLKKARELGGTLTIVVARDDTAIKLKKKVPRYKLKERISALEKEGIADKVLPGDSELNSWKVLLSLQPNIICFGYDQEKLARALEKEHFDFTPRFHTLPAYQPDHFHSSILNEQTSS